MFDKCRMAKFTANLVYIAKSMMPSCLVVRAISKIHAQNIETAGCLIEPIGATLNQHWPVPGIGGQPVFRSGILRQSASAVRLSPVTATSTIDFDDRLTPPFAPAISAPCDRRLPQARGGATRFGYPLESLCWPIAKLTVPARSGPARSGGGWRDTRTHTTFRTWRIKLDGQYKVGQENGAQDRT